MTDKTTPTFVEYITFSGVKLHIQPLNVPAVRAVALRAESLYPYPDPKPYQKPMENAVDGTLTPAEDDPEYRALCAKANAEREDWANRAIVDYCTTFPDFTTREEILNYFAPQRDKLRKIATFENNDDWFVTFYYIILNGTQIQNRVIVMNDYQNVLNICTQAVALTGGEILEGIRLFRPVIRGNAALPAVG